MGHFLLFDRKPSLENSFSMWVPDLVEPFVKAAGTGKKVNYRYWHQKTGVRTCMTPP